MGCGSSGESPEATDFSGPPDATLTTDEGSFHVEIRTAPEPPSRGANVLQLRITEIATGVDGVHLFMPGTWELRTTLARGATVEHATPSFQIP